MNAEIERVVVAGSRDIHDRELVRSILSEQVPWSIETLVHGDAAGVDRLAKGWAKDNGIVAESHPIPEWAWEKVGNRAGPMRNAHMAEQSDALVAIWDGSSRGTKNMIREAVGAGIPVKKFVVRDGWIEKTEVIDGEQSDLASF